MASLRERLFRRHGPRRLGRLTREGKAFVAVTVGVGVAAVNTGNNLLYLMLGLMLSLLLLSMVLSENALRGVRVLRTLPRRAFAGSPCVVTLSLHNDKRWLPSYSLEIEDRAENAPTDRRCFFLKVGAASSQSATYRRTPPARGVLRIAGYRVSTRYPFGLVEKVRVFDWLDELLVYPAIVPVEVEHPGALREGAERPLSRRGPGMDIAGLREYRERDPANWIHWRRSATLGSLVVREHDREGTARVTVVLDNQRPDGAGAAWDESFERAVSRTASLAGALIARGASVDVATRGATSPVVPGGAAPDPIWAFLARLPAVAVGEGLHLAKPRGDVRTVQVDQRALRGAA